MSILPSSLWGRVLTILFLLVLVAIVAGFMRGVEAAHQRFGKMLWAGVFEPVIDLAEQGFETDAGLAGQFAARKTILAHDPETHAHFIREDGEYYQEGDHFRQPALAETLRQVVAQGALGKLWGSYQTITSGTISPELEQAVAERGLDIVFNRSYGGYVVGATIDPDSGERHGGTILQFGGRPVGY